MLIGERDLGTPVSGAADTVTLEIDGHPVTVPAATSVMRAALSAGLDIPRLCATDSLKSFGGCRLCVVEIDGRKGYPASCTTPVEDGMRVRTQSPALHKLRRNVMELLISDHPLYCLTCPANGDCQLQEMAGKVGLREVRYGQDGANHFNLPSDLSNPYFAFTPSKCILCSRCVRACQEVQGTFTLSIDGRGFASAITPGANEAFLGSECVSCGACVQACPTASLIEKTVVEMGQADRSVVTTCAYCGVGCSLKAEIKGRQVVRMIPWKDGKANHGHACVKGRFAWGYATHPDRVVEPMIRDTIHEPWRTVSWQEALDFAASRFKRIQATYGRGAVGATTSSRCTNEETYLVQKMVRVALGNNNLDTCARVCHAPTGYGMGTTLGTSAGTQDFDSIDQAGVILVIGANPTEAHPVFGARIKKRVREGAKLIVIDPRGTELVRTAHVAATHHLALRPGSNVAMLNALAHVVVTEGLVDEAFVAARCDAATFAAWRAFVADGRHSPEAAEGHTGVAAAAVRAAARLYAQAGNGAIYFGLGVTEHSQGSTAVMAIANLAMATGNFGRPGVGVSPMRGQNNVQGSCDMGSFPHEFPGYRHVSDAAVRASFEAAWGVSLDAEPGLRLPNMLDAAIGGTFKGLYVQGEDIVQSDPNAQHVIAALMAMDCVIVHDLFLNQTAEFAHVFLPGSSFLEKDGTFTNAERRINRVRTAIPPLAGLADWQVTMALSAALGYPMAYDHPSQIMDEIARLTPAFRGIGYARLDRLGSVQWPCNDAAPEGTPVMHISGFAGGPGRFMLTEFVATDERITPRFPLILTTGRTLTQYNVGTQTRRTGNLVWHDEDVLEIHAQDAELYGIGDGDWVAVESRAGNTTLRAKVSERVQPGVVFTTFHHPDSGTNTLTHDNADWATTCPEYKVVAVNIRPTNTRSSWQDRRADLVRQARPMEPHHG